VEISAAERAAPSVTCSS